MFWNLKVYSHGHKNPPLVPVLNQINPAHTTPSLLRSISILYSHPHLSLSSGLSFSLSHQNPIRIPLCSHACNIPFPFHPWLDDSKYT
jgi:hypothetical protein